MLQWVGWRTWSWTRPISGRSTARATERAPDRSGLPLVEVRPGHRGAVPGGKFAIIDGQHRATAAALAGHRERARPGDHRRPGRAGRGLQVDQRPGHAHAQGWRCTTRRSQPATPRLPSWIWRRGRRHDPEVPQAGEPPGRRRDAGAGLDRRGAEGLRPRGAYKPIRYPWALEACRRQHQIHWLPEEAQLGEDIRLGRGAQPDRRRAGLPDPRLPVLHPVRRRGERLLHDRSTPRSSGPPRCG
jgi:hypothetical protein